MDLKVNTKALHKVLSVLIKGVPNKSLLPILDNFLLKVSNGDAVLMAFDGEIMLTAKINALEIKGDASFAIPAKLLTTLVSAMTDGELCLSYNSGEPSLICNWDNGNSTLPVFNSEDFPEPKVPVTDSQISFNQAFLKSALAKTCATVTENENRPAISGINFDVRKDGSTIAGTDGGVLVCVDAPVTGDRNFIIPLKAANILKSMLDKNSTVTVQSDGKTALFDLGQFSMNTLVINKKYPDYKKVIPQQNPYSLCVKREKLEDAIKRVMICADKGSMMIKVKLSYNEMQLIGEDLAFQYVANETLSCEYDGEDMEVGFKAPSLLLLVSNMECDDVEIKFQASNKATLVVPAGDQIKDEPVTSVIMPMVVQK